VDAKGNPISYGPLINIPAGAWDRFDLGLAFLDSMIRQRGRFSGSRSPLAE
jgi:hypothetical protein